MPASRALRASLAAGAALVLVAALGGCSPVVSMAPAPGANDPGCADVIVRLPDTVADLPRRETNAQATGAWGSPAGVLLYCGVEVPSASSYTCVEVEGLYWLRNDDDAPTYTFRLYGREPAIDVVVDSERAGGLAALTDLRRAVATTQPNGHECVDIGDATPAPTPSG